MKNYWLSLVICVIFIVFSVFLYRNVPGDDLSSSYIACRLLIKENTNHIYDFDPVYFHIVDDSAWINIARETSFHGFLHPYVQIPLWIFILKPICGAMGFPYFNLLFLIINFISFAAIVWITAYQWTPKFLEHPLWLAGIFILFSLFTPVRYSAFLNQTHPLFLAIAVLALFLASRKKNIWAGVILMISVSVKLIFAPIIVYWLLKRQYRAVLSFCISFLLMVVASIFLLGWRLNLTYIENLHRISNTLLVAYNNQSFASWIGGLSASPEDIFNWRIYSLPTCLNILSFGCMGLILGIIAILQIRHKQNHVLFESVSVSAILVASTIFTPIAWTHYYIVLIVPLMVLLSHGLETKKSWLLIVTFIILLLNIWPIALNPINPVINPISLIRSHFLSGIICIVALLVEEYSLKSLNVD